MKNVALHLSEITWLPVKPTPDGLVGFCSMVLCDSFYLGNIALHATGTGDLRLVYPDKVLPNGKRIHVFHPITKEAGNIVLSAVSEKYQQVTNGGKVCPDERNY